MTLPDSGPRLSAGYWLHHAALRWRAELDRALSPLGLTPTQFILLGTIGWLEHVAGAPTQQQVADGAGTDRMMTSKVVRALERRGLVGRSGHESDARKMRLSLTAEGRALTERAAATARDVDHAFFGPAAGELRARLHRLAEPDAGTG